MTDRERFVNHLLGREVDRVPFCLFWGPWGTTWRRWQREGKPESIRDHRGFASPDSSPMTVGVNYGPCPAFQRQVFEETADYVVHTDAWGIIRRDYKGGTSMSQFLKFPVAGREDWESFKAQRLDPHHVDRLKGDWLKACQEAMKRGRPIQLGGYPSTTYYGGLRWLLGDEECLVAFYDDPQLVHDIMDHLCTVHLAVFQAVVDAGVRVDVIHIWEDMCGRQGSLISPRHWREFMGPCYFRVKAFAEAHDIPLISVDTDGWPDAIIPPMMEHGVNYLYPMEVAAGCDVNDYRRRYPTLGMMGGIDKRALAKEPEAIEAELDRIWSCVLTGRYIPDLDHLIPDDISWDNWVYYTKALRRRIYGEKG